MGKLGDLVTENLVLERLTPGPCPSASKARECQHLQFNSFIAILFACYQMIEICLCVVKYNKLYRKDIYKR